MPWRWNAGDGTTIKATEWLEWVDEDEEDIRILDFGEAFPQGAEPRAPAQPGTLQVPETIFTDCLDNHVDLWRAGCMYLGDDVVLVAQMIGFVEQLPQEWQRTWERLQSSSEHKFNLEENFRISGLETRFNERVHDSALGHLIVVIRGLMRFLPLSRMKESEALDVLRSRQKSKENFEYINH